MELWIRSQNKGTLMKVEILGQTDGIIKAYFPNGNVELGNYKTVERALEVLDEIQSILLPNIKLITRNYTDEELEECSIKDLVVPPIEDVKIQELSTYVYEMPEK